MFYVACATSGLIYGVIAAFIGVPCIMSCSYRTKMRSRYGLLETPAPDWVTHCFCEWCALCQVYRELKTRGLDPAIGILKLVNAIVHILVNFLRVKIIFVVYHLITSKLGV